MKQKKKKTVQIIKLTLVMAAPTIQNNHKTDKPIISPRLINKGFRNVYVSNIYTGKENDDEFIAKTFQRSSLV